MKKILINLIRFYQKHFSKLKGAPCCRFYPNCSAYAIEAIDIHGAFIGSCLSFWRIIRCNPLCKGGVDPVPPKIQLNSKRKK